MITRCDEWTHIADDWLYSLWHRPDRDQLYRSLSQEADVFTFAVGDSDESFEFGLYVAGTVARRHVVDSPSYSDRVVRISVGDPLPGESSWLLQSDGSDIGFKLAEAQGIEVDQSRRALRCFSIPGPEWWAASQAERHAHSDGE